MNDDDYEEEEVHMKPEGETGPRKVRLPGFVKEEMGLGDAIKRVTETIGVKPCGPCRERAAQLNRRVILAPWTHA